MKSFDEHDCMEFLCSIHFITFINHLNSLSFVINEYFVHKQFIFVKKKSPLVGGLIVIDVVRLVCASCKRRIMHQQLQSQSP